MIARISLPWPARTLHPNSRKHWRQVRSAAKAAKHLAHWTMKEAGVRPIEPRPLLVSLDFFPPDNRRRDLDGMISSMKASLDGIADALGVDDNLFRIAAKKSGDTFPNGAVIVEISEAV